MLDQDEPEALTTSGPMTSRLDRLEYVCSSDAAARSLAESYVGLKTV